MFFELLIALSTGTTTVSQAGMPYMPNLVFKVVVAAVVLFFSPLDVLSVIDCVFGAQNEFVLRFCS